MFCIIAIHFCLLVKGLNWNFCNSWNISFDRTTENNFHVIQKVDEANYRIDHVLLCNSIDFYWTWSYRSCGGLKDSKWEATNGRAFYDEVFREFHPLKKIIKPTKVAIDIGAQVGDSTIPIALIAKKTIAFDPSKYFDVLRYNALSPKHRCV